MHVSTIAGVLWAASVFLEAALVFVLFYRRRYRQVPAFTAWTGYQLIYAGACFVVFRLGSKQLYRDVYWSGAFFDFMLQISVVLEIAASVLRRRGRWVEGAGIRLAAAGVAAPAIALLLAWKMTPAAETALDAWDARLSLFTTVLVCLLFTSIMASSQQLGLAWRSHVMREGYGFTAWVLIAFMTDTLHAYWRTTESFSALEYVRMACYLGALVYWSIAFWVPEKVMAAPPSDIKEQMKKLGLPID